MCIIDKQVYLKPAAVMLHYSCLITLQLHITVLLQIPIQNEIHEPTNQLINSHDQVIYQPKLFFWPNQH